jgi:hypothetical protein
MNRMNMLAVMSVGLGVSATGVMAGYTNAWDYKGNARGLHLNFLPSAVGHGVNEPPGAIEPDPTAGDNLFSIADASRRAAMAWNAAGTGWNLNIGGMANAGEITIDVRMWIVDPNDATKNEFVPPSSQEAANDPDANPNNPKMVLAFFRILTRDVNDNRFVTKAEIVFNNFATWGVGTNAGVKEDMDYDPIIVALHEIGHAIRLEHNNAGGSTVIGNPRDGSVMRPYTAAGWHQTNKNMVFDRNPAMLDTMDAGASFGDPLPAPGAMVLAGMGAVVVSRRRR